MSGVMGSTCISVTLAMLTTDLFSLSMQSMPMRVSCRINSTICSPPSLVATYTLASPSRM